MKARLQYEASILSYQQFLIKFKFGKYTILAQYLADQN